MPAVILRMVDDPLASAGYTAWVDVFLFLVTTCFESLMDLSILVAVMSYLLLM